MNLNPQQLAKEGIQNFGEEIRMMSAEKLSLFFTMTTSNSLNAGFLIKNIIYQSYDWIRRGKQARFEGGIRSFWFSHIKPTLKRARLLTRRGDFYQMTLDILEELVEEKQFFKYYDFGFDYENWENQNIGLELPQVILFAQKRSWLRTLKQLHERFGLTTMIFYDEPSAISVEYLARNLEMVTSLDNKFELLSLVDFSPDGFRIENNFKKLLEKQGIQNINVTPLVSLENYTRAEIEFLKTPISFKNPSQVEKWMRKTKGIHGKPFGLDSDSLTPSRCKKLVNVFLREKGFCQKPLSRFLYADYYRPFLDLP